MTFIGKAGAALAALHILTATAGAQTKDPALRDAVSMAATAMFLNSGAPGLIVAVVHGDETEIAGVGETAPGSKTEPDGRSILRLGSISKVFTGDLLADMAAQGRVGLSDPFTRHVPAGAVVKSFGGRPFTLLDLATHSAGLPRELPDPAVMGEGNPFAAYSADHYWSWMRQNAPAYAPGTTAIYSNVGFGLLGEALAQAGGKPFPDLLRDRITAPLGMADTVARLSDAQKPRLMTGLDPFGNPDPNWEATPIMAASGGLYSTADDMARWMRWHLSGEAQATMALAHALWRPHDGLRRAVGVEVTDSEGMGLGWVVSRARDGVPLLLGKSGGLGGFMTYVVLAPNRKLGIFVAASRVNFAMFEGIRQSVRNLAAELAPAGSQAPVR